MPLKPGKNGIGGVGQRRRENDEGRGDGIGTDGRAGRGEGGLE